VCFGHVRREFDCGWPSWHRAVYSVKCITSRRDEVWIGSGGTANTVSANGDLYVQDGLEVDGTTVLGSNVASGTQVHLKLTWLLEALEREIFMQLSLQQALKRSVGMLQGHH